MKTTTSTQTNMSTGWKAAALGVGFASYLAVCTTAYAMAPENSNKLTGVGPAVNQIPWVSGLASWQALDDQRLVVSLDAKHSYLLTLTKHCPRLPTAKHLGVSASNNTVYAGFDYITADGRQCSIHKINRISPKQKQWLTKV